MNLFEPTPRHPVKLFLMIFDTFSHFLDRTKALVFFLGALFLLWFAVEALVWRSGLYYKVAEPWSNTGATVNALMNIERVYRPGSRTVLVFGDSRVAEGFSGQLASNGGHINFINLAVPGSTPRTWYYLLRKIDRSGYKYEAVLVCLGFSTLQRRASEWVLDPPHDAPLLDLRDTFSYPESFSTSEMRRRAAYAILAPAVTMQEDVRTFLTAPIQRWQEVFRERPGYLGALTVYSGHEERMPPIAFNLNREVCDWGSSTAEQRALVEANIASLRTKPNLPLEADNHAYDAKWLSTIAAWVHAHGAKTIFFRLPRGPYRDLLPREFAPLPVEAADGLIILPGDVAGELERPEYFFDFLHLNRFGRARMTAILSNNVRTLLSGK